MSGLRKAVNLSFQGERKKKKGSNCMPFWKRQNYGDNEKINGCQEYAER